MQRTIGFLGATGVGVGAIVGGGIFVLAGVAFAQAGPGAMVAFALNGVLALLTALSFAEMATANPESGGPYVFAKRVMSVRSAFAVGWILWFAYIVTSVLYALGFASYAVLAIRTLLGADGLAGLEWLGSRAFHLLLAGLAVGFYTFRLLRQAPGSSDWATIGKLVLFVVLLLAGFWALLGADGEQVTSHLSPFLPNGGVGLLAAMGFTFIAVQGFDLIAAMAGEVKQPERTIPRAMLTSLAVAMVIYIPLLFLVATVGTPEGTTIDKLSRAMPETVMAVAAENFMGRAGYWVVVVTAILATLSALRANLMAASRVAASMADDRTLPLELAERAGPHGVPGLAIYASSLAVLGLVFMLPSVAAAGAAASLIFLLTFALTHVTAYLARTRGSRPPPFRTWLFPLVPVVGGLGCAALAVFQAVVVPTAGVIVLLWLGLGAFLYVARFAGRAEALDAAAEAQDPDLVRLRGRRPLVLTPLANPETAPILAAVAEALAPPDVGRILLLSVVPPGGGADLKAVDNAQAALRAGLAMTLTGHRATTALIGVADDPLDEIRRIAEERRCEVLLLGLTQLADRTAEARVERLMSQVECDVVVLHSPPGYQFVRPNRILVPVAGRGGHDALRARLLSSLNRRWLRQVTFLRVLPSDTSDEGVAEAQESLDLYALEEVAEGGRGEVVRSDDVVAAITQRASEHDAVIMGLRRVGRRKRLFSELALAVARSTPGLTVLISRK